MSLRPGYSSYMVLALAASLSAATVQAETAKKFRKKKKAAHKAEACCDKLAAACTDPRETEINQLKEQVSLLITSQQALLTRLQEVEGRTSPAAKKEAEDIAITKAYVDKQLEIQRGSVDKFEKKFGPGGKPTITPYGFLRIDYHMDSARLNNIENPFFVNPAPVAGVQDNKNEAEMTPRLTRLGWDFGGSEAALWGSHPKVGGKLELDFVNGGSESREIIRIRHAYASIDWKEISVMAGQYWDLIAPLAPSVNPFTLLWNAGNLGDRRPQFRVTYEPDRDHPHKGGQWSFAGAALQTDAVSGQDLDGNGAAAAPGGVDGVEAARPMYQGRVGWTAHKRKDPLSDPFSFGVWGMNAREELTTPIGDRKVFRPDCVGIDMVVPIARRLDLRGEAWNGKDLNDVRGGINQGVAITGVKVKNAAEVGAHGGWLELTLNPRGRYWASAGVSHDVPRVADLGGASDRKDNRVVYQTNHFRLGGGLELWLDFSNWRTEFTDAATQSSTRTEFAVQQNF